MDRPRVPLLVVGNPCHDTLLDARGGVHRVAGGSSSYIAAVLAALGLPFQVIGKVGSDFRHAGDLAFTPTVEGERSTAFVDDYRAGDRRQRLEAAGPRIRPDEVQVPCELALACGVAGEVLPETLLALRRASRLLLADAQGLVRRFAPDGAVGLVRLCDSPWADVAGQLDHLKVGGAERAAVDPERLRATLVCTEGEAGATLHGPPDVYGVRTRQPIAAVPAQEVDSTGAGDCFLAGYAAALLHGRTPAEAARFGALCGARAVEQVGLPRFDRGELRRAL